MNPFTWPFRAQFAFGALACAALLGYAIYSQYQLFLDPCPLCIFQRVVFIAMGIVFLLGAVALTGAHLASGLLNARTLPLSAAMVVPGLAGMALGFALQDRLDVVQFRRWTLILLVLTGANLIRRSLSM